MWYHKRCKNKTAQDASNICAALAKKVMEDFDGLPHFTAIQMDIQPCFSSLRIWGIMAIYIYALKDPFTDEIRYIGKSIRPRERLANQCNEKSNTYRSHWIQSILSQGSKPIQEILEILPDDSNWQEVEKKWIAYGRSLGWNLTNATDGGDGVLNLSGESKERMIKTWTGRKHRPESLLKIGQASKGRKFSEEALKRKSEKMKGRIISSEHRAKISASNKKLTNDQVVEIRNLIASGFKQYEIAKLYGVDKGTISNIHRKKSYADV